MTSVAPAARNAISDERHRGVEDERGEGDRTGPGDHPADPADQPRVRPLGPDQQRRDQRRDRRDGGQQTGALRAVPEVRGVGHHQALDGHPEHGADRHGRRRDHDQPVGRERTDGGPDERLPLGVRVAGAGRPAAGDEERPRRRTTGRSAPSATRRTGRRHEDTTRREADQGHRLPGAGPQRQHAHVPVAGQLRQGRADRPPGTADRRARRRRPAPSTNGHREVDEGEQQVDGRPRHSSETTMTVRCG